MTYAIELTKALVPLAWPIILATVLWKLFPTIRAIAASRSFAVKVAGMEVSVQDATEQLRAQIEDLQKQVIRLRQVASANPSQPPPSAPSPERQEPATILWVDDMPSNNAFEIAQLQGQNVHIVQALSTDEAMAALHDDDRVTAVISDMGRRENGAYDAQAGLRLLTAMRQAQLRQPFIVYSTKNRVRANQQAVVAAGGDGATASAVELLEWLRSTLRLTPQRSE